MSLQIRRRAARCAGDCHTDSWYRSTLGTDDRPRNWPESRSDRTARGRCCAGILFEHDLMADHLIGNMKRSQNSLEKIAQAFVIGNHRNPLAVLKDFIAIREPDFSGG